MKAWLKAFRLKTLPLSLGGVIVGNVLGYHSIKVCVATNANCHLHCELFGYTQFYNGIFAFSILTAIFLQILSNLANDYGDFSKGTDSGRLDRALASGSISKNQMKRAIWITGALAFVSGLLLINKSLGAFTTDWWAFLALGIGAIAAAILYTMGKLSYGYKGLGDLSVLLFFGLVAVCGTAYLYCSSIDIYYVLPAIAYGLIAVAVLNINNIRDINSDRLSNKFTIPTRLGRKGAEYYHLIILTVALFCLFMFHAWQGSSQAYLLPIGLLMGLHWSFLRRIDTVEAYNKQLRNVSLGALFLAILFAVQVNAVTVCPL